MYLYLESDDKVLEELRRGKIIVNGSVWGSLGITQDSLLGILVASIGGRNRMDYAEVQKSEHMCKGYCVKWLGALENSIN